MFIPCCLPAEWPSFLFIRFFTAEPESEDEDDSEDLLRRTGNFIGSSDSLPKGIIKVCYSTCD